MSGWIEQVPIEQFFLFFQFLHKLKENIKLFKKENNLTLVFKTAFFSLTS